MFNVHNPTMHEWTKYIKIDSHYIYDKVYQVFMSMSHVHYVEYPMIHFFAKLGIFFINML